MNKTLITLAMGIGSFIGSYIPIIFGVDPLSFVCVITGAIGGICGIIIMYKIINN